MATSVSEWTRMGSNSNATTEGFNLENAPGTASEVRRECTMWLDGNNVAKTEPFNWPVHGDFTVTFNATKQTVDAADGTTLYKVWGSVTGEEGTYVQMVQLGTGTWNNAVKMFNYDRDNSGIMPYMRLEVTQGSNPADNTDKPIKVVVTPH